MAVMDPLENLKVAIGAMVWGAALSSLPPGRRGAVKCLRMGHMVLREIAEGTLTLRAASLVFTSLLSLVPLLAVSFSLLKAFGVRSRLEDVLFNFLSPLGDRGHELATQIVAFVEKVNMGLLGGVGLVILFITVMSLVQKVEQALNASWRVRASRNFAQRFSGYLSVLLVGPLLVIAALGLMGAIMGTPLVRALAEVEPFGTLLAMVPKLLPYVLMIGAFSFIYRLMPNTRVTNGSALIGGAIAGILWATAGWGFAAFIVNSPGSNYHAIYSSFAIIFFFLLWLYIAWLILLIGGTVAFYHQHPEYLGVMPGELKSSARLRERIALAVMARLGHAHLYGGGPVSADRLARDMRVPMLLVQDALMALMDDGYVVQVESPSVGFLPARDLGALALTDILSCARGAHDHQHLTPEHLASDPVVESLMASLEEGTAKVMGGRTLRDLVAQLDDERANHPVPLKRV